MATKTIAWNNGNGNITVTYNGSGDGTIIVTSSDNNLYEDRSQDITVQTTAGSPQQTKKITIVQAAKVRIDLSNAVVTAANQTYNGSAKTPVPTVILNGETVPSTGYDITYSNNTNAGTATITITGKGDYTGTANGTFTIAKANPVYVAPTANNRTYNTSSAALLVAGSNTTPGTFTYCATQSGTYSTTIPNQINAGTYTTYWKFTPTDSNNYNSVGATAVSTTISPKTVSSPTITLSQSTYTYSGSACQPTPTVKDGTVTISSSEYTVSYSNNTNAGTATVTITDKSGGNYTVSGSTTFTINKADPTYTAPTASSLTYSRSAQYLITTGSTSHGTIQYSSNGTSWSTTRPQGTNAGEYTSYWRLVGDSNHNDVASTSIITTIAKRTPVVATAPSLVTGLTYTGSAQNLLSGGSMKHSSSVSTAVAGTFTYAQQTNAGTYSNPTWSFVPTDTTNYNNASGSVTGSVTIAKAAPSYTAPVAQTLTYNGSSQYLITAGSTSHGTIQYSTNGTSWSTTRPSQTNAGTYTAYWKLVGDTNHNDVASTQISNVGIAQKALTITAKAQSVTYGTAITQGTGQITVSGLVSGHSVTAITLTQSTTNVTTTGTITPSAATIKQSSTDVTANYSITYNTGTLTITAATPSYTAPTAKTLTYSGSAQALVNAGSSSDGTFTYKLSTASSYGSSIPTGTSAGGYTVNWKFVADANHGGGTETGNVSVTIAQKSLTITAKAQSISYGGSIATGTSQVTTSGLVSGDTLTAVTLTASTSDVTTSGTITPSAASTTKGVGNYNVTYNTGNLTITAVPASVTTAPTAKTLSYTGSAQALVNAGTASGGTMYYKMTTTNSKPTSTSGFSASIPTGTNAGSAYYVWYYVKGDSNHTDTAISSTAVNVTISKASISPTVSMNGWTYGGTATNPSVSGNSGSGSVTYSYKKTTDPDTSYSSTKPSDAGSYTVRAVIAETTNYLGATCTNTFTIAKAAPTYTAPAALTPTYSGSAQSLVSAGVSSHGTFTYATSQSGTYSSSIPTGTNAGNYTVWWKLTGDSNHTDISATQVSGVTIVQATGDVTTVPTAINNLSYTGSSQYLVTAGSGTGTMYYRYKLSTSSSWSSWSTSRPSRTDAGTYNIEYYAAASTNYTQSATGSLNATIAQASRTLSFADTIVVLPPSGTVTKTATPSAGAGDGAITYSIASTTYATINSSTGAVTAKTTEGNTTVTATIAAGTNYNSATASYSLYVFAETHNYSYSESTQTIALPPGSYKLQCWGAQGGSNAADATYGITAQAGGKGGYSEGILTIADSTTVKVNVGGQGGSASAGWNGGGSSTGSSTYNASNILGITKMAGGGGGTDIRLSDNALLSRMIVAGGGSGGAMAYKKETSGGITYEDIYTNNTNAANTYTYYSSNNRTYCTYYNIGIQVTAGETYTLKLTGSVYACDYEFMDSNSSHIKDQWLYVSDGDTSVEVPSNASYVRLTVVVIGEYSSSNKPNFDFAIQQKVDTTQVVETRESQVGYVGGGTTGGGYSDTYKGKQMSAGNGGSFGQGANQTVSNYRFTPPGCGGGWYGGGKANNSDTTITTIKQSGGGSGFVNISASSGSRPSGYTGLELDSGATYDGTQTFESTSGSTETGHSGNGYARITRVEVQSVYNFDYTGAVQSETLPAGTYKLEVWGAQGGSIDTTYVGGKGGYSVGELTLAAPTALYVYVGGQGSGGNTATSYTGGFNGGGNGYCISNDRCSGGGGSDIRIGTDSLYARVIVAGGGGGACKYSSSKSYSGANGGGESGSNGAPSSSMNKGGIGGSATKAGDSYNTRTKNPTNYGASKAAFGTGGGWVSGTNQTTGGGGGWYGGGWASQGSGGGGSGYVYTSTSASNYPSGCLLNGNYYLANASTVAGISSMPKPDGSGDEAGHEGNGFVRITKL